MRTVRPLLGLTIAAGAWLIAQEDRWTNAVEDFALRLAEACAGDRKDADRRQSTVGQGRQARADLESFSPPPPP